MLLSSIVSPIILGIIFFLMITPIAMVCNLIGRDELKLRVNSKNSFWIKRRK